MYIIYEQMLTGGDKMYNKTIKWTRFIVINVVFITIIAKWDSNE